MANHSYDDVTKREISGYLCGAVVIICGAVLFSKEHFTRDELLPLFLTLIVPVPILISACKEYARRRALWWEKSVAGPTVGPQTHKYRWRTVEGLEAQDVALRRMRWSIFLVVLITSTWAFRSDWSQPFTVRWGSLTRQPPHVSQQDRARWDANRAADAWLTNLSYGEIAALWEKSAPVLRQSMEASALSQRANGIRESAGISGAAGHDWIRTEVLSPDRMLVYFSYKSPFRGMFQEEVTVVRDEQSNWKVAQYVIRPFQKNEPLGCLPACPASNAPRSQGE